MSFFESVKTLLSDKRGRALVKLGIYILFMAFVIMYVQVKNDRKPTKQTNINTPKTTYSETIKFLDTEYELKSNDGIIRFSKDDHEYVVMDDEVYEGKNLVDFEFLFWKLTPTLINDLTKDIEPYSETKYKDSTIEKTYYVSLIDFTKKFQDNNSLEEFEDKDIIIKIKKKDSEIVSVYLDLTNYYYFLEQDKNLEVEITY